MDELYITGVGICSPIGIGQEAFAKALFSGHQVFGYMQRPGRQCPDIRLPPFVGAELSLDQMIMPISVSDRVLRTMSLSARAAVACVNEAWRDAQLDRYAPEQIGLILGGTNLQQRELTQIQASYRDRCEYLRPTYGLRFMDTDICGICTEVFNIRGCGFTVGGASASGLLAVIQAIQAVLSGAVEVCIAVGGLMDLSWYECQGLRALGAMGSDRFQDQPELAARPFDVEHDGFIFGENSAAVVVARPQPGYSAKNYARIAGWGMAMDANRNPDPSCDGEVAVIRQALTMAKCAPSDVDYINPHGTGSQLGDTIELRALKASGLSAAYINATKSLIGHGLSAAGTAELVATLLQMHAAKLHPTRNLITPIEQDFNWVFGEPIAHNINTALKLSFGFGGINTALCLNQPLS